jgi:nucleotide-binding universal stress UspA family protein
MRVHHDGGGAGSYPCAMERKEFRNEIRVFLPLEPEEPMTDLVNLIPALLPPQITRLKRLYVCRPLQADLFLPEMSYALPEIAQLELEAQIAASHQSRLAAQPLVRLGYPVESDVALGHPIPELLREISLWRSDLVVVRARKASADDQRLGALTLALLQNATCPVLVHRNVPSGYKAKRILIATDFSAASRVSADWGLGIAESAGAEAHLLYVLARQADRSGIDEASLVSIANQEIERWRHPADGLSRPYTDAHVIRAETPAEGILQFSRDGDFDMVVLAGTGRSAFWAVVLGSNARTVARLSDVPVLLVPTSNRVLAQSFTRKLEASHVHEPVAPGR